MVTRRGRSRKVRLVEKGAPGPLPLGAKSPPHPSPAPPPQAAPRSRLARRPLCGLCLQLLRPASEPGPLCHVDFPDKEINALGARGIGEIGLAGIAAAITAAVHHATGVRVRELPVKIEQLSG